VIKSTYSVTFLLNDDIYEIYLNPIENVMYKVKVFRSVLGLMDQNRINGDIEYGLWGCVKPVHVVGS